VELITSLSNSKVKQTRVLRQRKGREESKTFLVEGIHPVGAAVEAGFDLTTVFYASDFLESLFAHELIERLKTQGIPCYATSREVFESLADKENPQGILAVARQSSLGLADLTAKNFPWGVALVAPQDPGNVGTILRTIDAVGASGVLLLENSVDAYHPTAVRASMGAIFRLAVVTASFADFVSWARPQGYHIYGSSAHAEWDYRQVEHYHKPAILLLGSEREGLTPEQCAVCERVLRLPMRGKVTSLNLAVAAGVLLYAMLDKEEQG
jgi:RNA methyltransferase, TrmH family